MPHLLRDARRFISVGALVILLGCSADRESPSNAKLEGTINVLVSLDGSEDFAKGKLEEQALLAKQFAKDFEFVHPEVDIQIEIARETDLLKKVRDRHDYGLSPDLMLVRSLAARNLYEAGLSRPATLTSDYNLKLNPGIYQRLLIDDQNLTGIPVFLFPQIACYNKERLARSPDTLNQLLQLSEQGHEMGIELDMVNLFWTVGSWGGPSALQALSSNTTPHLLHQRGIQRWLAVLLQVGNHKNVKLFGDQEELVRGLISNRLDWITCRSSSLARLRNQMGSRLGVWSLPSGPEGPPSPLLISKSWVYGKDSSSNQRRIAESFVRFSVNPVNQRYISLATEQMLPANQGVPIAVGRSPSLKAMIISEQQALHDGSAITTRNWNSVGYKQLRSVTQLVTEMIYGERSPNQTATEVLRSFR